MNNKQSGTGKEVAEISQEVLYYKDLTEEEKKLVQQAAVVTLKKSNEEDKFSYVKELFATTVVLQKEKLMNEEKIQELETECFKLQDTLKGLEIDESLSIQKWLPSKKGTMSVEMARQMESWRKDFHDRLENKQKRYKK